MATTAILALDQGTTSSKALLVDATGRVHASGSCPVGISYPRPGWVEQDAGEIAASVTMAAQRALSAAPEIKVIGVAISNQRETVLGWDETTGEPVGPAISWQDQRGDAACQTLATCENGALVRARSGLELGPMFSASKIAWIIGQARSDRLRLGTIDAWLLNRITGGDTYACEAGNASRTLLFDIVGQTWDADLCAIFGVAPAALPPVRPSVGPWGGTRGFPGLPDGTPVLAVLGDSHAALYGHWALAPEAGRAGKATYGTGASVMLPVSDAALRLKGVGTTLAWQAPGPQWALEGNILYAGAGLDWLARTLGLPAGSALSDLAAETSGSRGTVFVPALNGLGAPWWEPSAMGALIGLDAATTRPEIARAGLEAVAHQVCDVVEAMDPEETQGWLHAGGGATASEELMQIQADLLGRGLLVSSHANISAIGVAALAFEVVGERFVPDSGLAPRLVEPALSFGADDRAEARARWREALNSVGVPGASTPDTTT